MVNRNKQVHVVHRDDGWHVTRPTKESPVSNHRSQENAIEAGRGLAKKIEGELYIHTKKGPIRDCDSYGSDPSRSKDTVF